MITDVIKFVQNPKEKLKSPEKEEEANNNKESKEPDYRINKEGKDEQEKGAG